MPPINLPLLGFASWSAHTNSTIGKLCPLDPLLSLPMRRLKDLGEAWCFSEVPHPGHYWMHSTAITLIKLTMCVGERLWGGEGPECERLHWSCGILERRAVLLTSSPSIPVSFKPPPAPRSAPQYERCDFLCTENPTKPNASGPVGGVAHHCCVPSDVCKLVCVGLQWMAFESERPQGVQHTHK